LGLSDIESDVNALIAVTGETRERVQIIQASTAEWTNLLGQVVEAVQALIEQTGEVHAEVTREVDDNSLGRLLGEMQATAQRNTRMLERLLTHAGLPPEA
jgi:hypothetical protein